MEETMDTSLDELGPVDYLVVEFPAGAQNFSGEMAKELVRLSEAGVIRLLDLLILKKHEDGSVDALEIDEAPGLDDMRTLEAEIAEILAGDDVEHLAAAMLPNSVAGVLVWENCWAAPVARTVVAVCAAAVVAHGVRRRGDRRGDRRDDRRDRR